MRTTLAEAEVAATRGGQIMEKDTENLYKIDDVAELAGVAKSTVSNYLNGRKVRAKNKEKIDQAIRSLNYHPNIIARGLKSSKVYSVGVLVSSLRESFSNIILSYVENYLQERNYAVIICSTEDDRTRQAEKIRFLLERRVDGFILLSSIITAEDVAPIREAGKPFVMVDRMVEGCVCDCVCIDNVSAIKRLIRYVAERGHRRIALISGEEEYSAQLRRAGYEQGMKECGLAVRQDYILREPYTIQGGYDGMLRLQKSCPDATAAIISNYEQTAGFIMAANEFSLNIPDDLSVVGFDNLNLASLARPKLTMATQPMQEMGIKAAELIYRRISKNWDGFPFTHMFDAVLEAGASVKDLR